MRPHEVLAGELVEPLREPFAQPPAVREDDRAAVAPDELEDPRVDGRPDAVATLRRRRRAAGLVVERQDLADRRHVVDRDDHLEIERLARAGVDDRDLAARAHAAEEARDRVERPLRGREPDALHGRRVLRPQGLQALEAEREVRAALRARDGVDLVDDDVLDAAEDLARLARQQQVQRLGRGDEDVRRPAGELAAVLGGGVAGAAGDRDGRDRLAQPLRLLGDPGQRRPQVPLDVVGQRLERRDVQDADEAGLGARAFRASGAWPGGPAPTGTRRGSCHSPSARG